MPNVYKPGLLQIRTQHTQNPDTGDIPENVLWFVSALLTTPTLVQLQAIQGYFDTNWAPIWQTVGPTNRDYMGSVITDWSSNTGLQSTSVGSFTPAAGTHSSESLPLQVAILLQWEIGVRYKGGHPHTYLPYCSASTQDTSDPSMVLASIRTAVNGGVGAFFTAMLAGGTLGGQTAVVYRHRNDPVNAVFHGIQAFNIASRFATQRRRIRRVAHH